VFNILYKTWKLLQQYRRDDNPYTLQKLRQTPKFEMFKHLEDKQILFDMADVLVDLFECGRWEKKKYKYYEINSDGKIVILLNKTEKVETNTKKAIPLFEKKYNEVFKKLKNVVFKTQEEADAYKLKKSRRSK